MRRGAVVVRPGSFPEACDAGDSSPDVALLHGFAKGVVPC